jgi:hypothetical protein
MNNIKKDFLTYLVNSGRFVNEFGRFSPAYTISNECLSEAMEVLKPCGKSVLTVAASGDQAFYYKINGASHVDTFDISYCAKIMMDIKTAAVQKLNYRGYRNFLNSIQLETSNVTQLRAFPKIAEVLPQDTKQFLDTVSGYRYRFSAGYNFNVMTARQYKKLRASVNEPFNFIWTDVMGLSGHLTRKYDQMYLSNIFQYNCDAEKNIKLIQGLLPSLNDGGEIMLCVTPFFRRFELDVIRNVAKALEKFVRIRLEATNHQQYAIVKKL